MTTANDDDLRAALARINPGDEVTVRIEYDGHGGTLSGTVWQEGGGLTVVNALLRHPEGTPGYMVREVLSHTPAPPPPATVADLDAAGTWAVATDDEGVAWVKGKDGLWRFGSLGVTAGSLTNRYSPATLRTDGEQA